MRASVAEERMRLRLRGKSAARRKGWQQGSGQADGQGAFAGAKGLLAGLAQQGITLDDTTNGLAAAAARRGRGSNGNNVD